MQIYLRSFSTVNVLFFFPFPFLRVRRKRPSERVMEMTDNERVSTRQITVEERLPNGSRRDPQRQRNTNHT